MMLIYLLKMIACSAAFYALYTILFRNEKMLVFNRFYLIASLLLSFTIPLISFTVYVNYSVNDTVIDISQPVKAVYYWMDYGMITLAAISITGSAVLLVRFIKNLVNLGRRTGSSDKLIGFKGVKMILLQEPVAPHSFLNTIFVNKDEYLDQHIENEVLEHELAHIKQKHSFDILFIELIQIFCWFNPVIYLYKRSIKINHELLADAAVVKKLGDVRSYQAILLQRAIAQSPLALASSFNFSTTKKRMIMLTKNTNPYRGWARSISALPMLAILIFLFAERSYAQKEESGIVVHDVKTVKRLANEPEDVKSTTVSYTKDRKKARIKINYNDGRMVEEDISTPEKAAAFEKKYGIELPPPPPPPPPTTRKMKIAVPPPPQAPSVNVAEQPLQPSLATLSSNKAGIPKPPAPPLPLSTAVWATSTMPQKALTAKERRLTILLELAGTELRLLKSRQDQEILKPMLNLDKNEQELPFNHGKESMTGSHGVAAVT